MAGRLVRSLPMAEHERYAGEDDGQDSQERLLYLIREHGIGVVGGNATMHIISPDLVRPIGADHSDLLRTTTSSPILGVHHRRSTKGTNRSGGSTIAPTSFPAANCKTRPRQPHHPQYASNTPVANPDADACGRADTSADTGAAFTSSSVGRPKRQRRDPLSFAHPSSVSPPTRHAQAPSQSVFRDAYPADNPPSWPTRDNAITQFTSSTSSLKKQTSAMSSQSPTQSNQGRSYEQYEQDGSQPSSPPGSFAEEHHTLEEGDTGYVNFKYPFDSSDSPLPDTAPNEPDTPFTRGSEHDDAHDQSQPTSQTATSRTERFAPGTPVSFPNPFLSGGTGHVMPASQLFGQTQPTSALKKASPTSSRPSPNNIGNHVTSPTNPTSSPLKNRGFDTTPLPAFASTSPGFPEQSPRPRDSTVSPLQSPVGAVRAVEDQDGDGMDETPLPRLFSRRGRNGREPINEYRPYRKQTLDSDLTRSSSQQSSDSDFGYDEAELRRQRARSNKERASRSFPEISVPLPSLARAKVEVPSTNRAGRLKEHPLVYSEEPSAKDHGDYTIVNSGSQETVADSQSAINQQKSTNGVDSLIPPPKDHSQSRHEYHNRPSSAPAESTEREMILETSPVCTSIEPPKRIGEILRESSGVSSDLLSLSCPEPTTDAFAETPRPPNKSGQPERNASAALAIEEPNIDSIGVVSSPSVVLASPRQSGSRRSSGPIKQVTPSSTASEPLLPSDPDASSSLSVLSATPVIASSSTPNTEDGHNGEPREIIVAASSPTVERGRRRGPTPPSSDISTPLKKPTTYTRSQRSFRRGTRQSSRHSSVSLDELDKSPNVSMAEDSRSGIRKSPRKSTTLREFQTRAGLFEGMVFAISLQGRQQSHRSKGKSLSKGNLEDMIRREGGQILDDGFNSLFEFDTLPISAESPSAPMLSNSLKLLNSEVGFTALIADGHSRKVKYMQALALGIPCLAPRWITTCLAKKEIVDWSSYLLCAGSSSLLGDAIRSRNLVPYDAPTAKLASVISHRPKLLNESKILLIMKRTKNEEKRLPYVFLAQVLGASLVRVNSVEEARAKLRETESGDEAFNWVYADDHLQDVRAALFGYGSGEGVSKKRKRMSMGIDAGGPPSKRIRTLNDELVIQSLILGRLIEEDEMEE